MTKEELLAEFESSVQASLDKVTADLMTAVEDIAKPAADENDLYAAVWPSRLPIDRRCRLRDL